MYTVRAEGLKAFCLLVGTAHPAMAIQFPVSNFIYPVAYWLIKPFNLLSVNKKIKIDIVILYLCFMFIYKLAL